MRKKKEEGGGLFLSSHALIGMFVSIIMNC